MGERSRGAHAIAIQLPTEGEGMLEQRKGNRSHRKVIDIQNYLTEIAP